MPEFSDSLCYFSHSFDKKVYLCIFGPKRVLNIRTELNVFTCLINYKISVDAPDGSLFFLIFSSYVLASHDIYSK